MEVGGSVSSYEELSATLAGRRLGVVLKAYRSRIGTLRVVDVAKAAGVSQPTWSQVENATVVPSQNQLERALGALEVDGGEAEDLLALRERAKRREWWHEYDDVADAGYLKLIGYEASATEIQHCSSGWLPGLLQTPAAARASVFVPGTPARPEDIDRIVGLRMARQHILKRPGLQYHAICGEEALRYRVGSPAILREQLLHLLDVTDTHPNVTLQAVPYSAGLHLGHSNPYTIFRFKNELDLPLVHFEYGATSSMTDSPTKLRRWTYVFGELQRMALTPADTARLIESISSELSA
jgi:transcriptional regulator with XRE-family HTH domain